MSQSAGSSERAFGVSVGTVLCAIALLFLWRGYTLRAEIAGALGAALLVCGLAYPRVLVRPSAWWWRFSRVLGHVNARLLLTLLFVAVFVPIGLIWRLTGRDPLARRHDRWVGWTAYPARYRDRHHYSHMY